MLILAYLDPGLKPVTLSVNFYCTSISHGQHDKGIPGRLQSVNHSSASMQPEDCLLYTSAVQPCSNPHMPCPADNRAQTSSYHLADSTSRMGAYMRASSKSSHWLQAQQLTQLQPRKVQRSLKKTKDLLSQQSPQNQCDMEQASAVAGYTAVLQTTTCAASLCLAGLSAQACKRRAAL